MWSLVCVYHFLYGGQETWIIDRGALGQKRLKNTALMYELCVTKCATTNIVAKHHGLQKDSFILRESVSSNMPRQILEMGLKPLP